MKRLISVAFPCLALVFGLMAAHYWYKSSKIEIVPCWAIEPGEPFLAQMGWIVGTMGAMKKSSELNKKAALLTAVSIVFGAISSVVGAFH